MNGSWCQYYDLHRYSGKGLHRDDGKVSGLGKMHTHLSMAISFSLLQWLSKSEFTLSHNWMDE